VFFSALVSEGILVQKEDGFFRLDKLLRSGG